MDASRLEELARVVREGGPRQRGQALIELSRIACNGVDLVPFLHLLGEGERRYADELKLTCDIQAGRVDDILALLSTPGGPETTQLSTLAMVPNHRPALMAPLMPAVVDGIETFEAERAVWAVRTLEWWLAADPSLAAPHLDRLVRDLGLPGKVRMHGGQTAVLGREVALTLTRVAHLDEVHRALEERLTDGDKAIREGAAYVLASAQPVGTLLEHRDAAVRRGAARRIADEAHDSERAAARLLEGAGLSPKTRYALAKAVADGRRVKGPPAVKAAVAALGEDDPLARSRIGEIAGMADEVDCRWAEPFLAVALADPEATVRRAAASALYYLYDMTPHERARVALPALERAVESEEDAEAAEEMRHALKAGGR